MTAEAEAKILIVDDLPENLLALSALIRQDGRTIHQAQSGEAALTLLLQHDFALAILDVQMPGMNGFELAELMRGTERTRHIPIVFVSAAGHELNYAFKGYESGAVDFLHKPLDNHAVRSKVSVFVDLYRQRKELRRQLDALEESQRQQEALLQQLRTAQAELQRVLGMRDDFLSAVSVELRSPLNNLFLETQARKMHVGMGASFRSDQLRNMIEGDERQIHAMLRVIDDMLDVSRLRKGKLTVRPRQVDLASLIQRVVASLGRQSEATGSPLQADVAQGLEVLADEFRIEQVLNHVLSNALQHGAGRPVTLQAASTDAQVRIEVRDQGPGIAVEDHERIFGEFERGLPPKVMAEPGSGGGLGLGLYISRQILDAHGGQISVNSVPGEGAVFTIVLPRATAAQPA